ncbi:MAG: DUF885 domain-containing protein [Bacteroidetes bacterium]|nr:MAG: DUF885 domain-containing protein [Bacteroidota bacterium]
MKILKHSYKALLYSCLVILTSCAEEKKHGKIVYTEAEMIAESSKANEFFAHSWQGRLERNPELQTFLGIKTDYGKWLDRSDSFAIREYQIISAELKELKSKIDFDKLDAETQLSFRCFEFEAQQEINMFQWRFHNYPVNQMDGIQSSAPALLINMHNIDSLEDAEAYISRLDGILVMFDQVIEGLKIRDSLGINPPAFVFPRVIEDCRNILDGAPFNNTAKRSPLLSDFINKVNACSRINANDKARLMQQVNQSLLKSVGPAYNNLIKFLSELEKKSTDNDGCWKFPDGNKFYKAALYHAITLDMTPEQVYELGVKEVDRIHKEMRQIMKKLGWKGDSLIEFFEYLRKDKRFYFENNDSGRKAYMKLATAIIDTMRNSLDDLFLTKPKANIVVKAVEPFREKSAGGAFYENPAIDGSRPAIYYINLYDMADQPIYQAEALAYHEGIPGHHMQIAIAQELQGIPEFRKYGGNVAYVEGWALYTELLPKEYGYYKDLYSDFGRLSNELFRAARLVVDVGIHYKRWSREKATEYFLRNTSNPEGDCRKEIDRYIVWPAQATGYKVGMNYMLELREYSKAQLGEEFDIREFHDVILTSGPLPMILLKEQVRNWVEKKKSRANPN